MIWREQHSFDHYFSTWNKSSSLLCPFRNISIKADLQIYTCICLYIFYHVFYLLFASQTFRYQRNLVKRWNTWSQWSRTENSSWSWTILRTQSTICLVIQVDSSQKHAFHTHSTTALKIYIPYMKSVHKSYIKFSPFFFLQCAGSLTVTGFSFPCIISIVFPMTDLRATTMYLHLG